MLLHWHHTVPQALGGADSLQIPLCAQCHNQLHANADAVVARVRNNRQITRQYWRTPEEQVHAQPYLEILVTAMLNAPEADGSKMWMVSARLPDGLHKALHLFKIDSGLANLEQALLLCLRETLASKGYHNANEVHQGQNQKRPQKPKAPLW